MQKIIIACTAIVSIAGTASAYADDLQNLRQQFHYGMELVVSCEHLVHSIPAASDCQSRAIFPSPDTRVRNAVTWGADYQMLVYEQRIGKGVVAGVRVRATVDDVFKGNAK